MLFVPSIYVPLTEIKILKPATHESYIEIGALRWRDLPPVGLPYSN